MIQKVTNATLFRIEPVYPYPNEYQRCTQLALKELQEHARPAILDYVADIERYDVVFIGYPNWWDTMPMPVFHFLESHNLDGKMIVPFCTHEGSGFGNSLIDLHALCPNAMIKQGLSLRGGEVKESEEQIKQWSKELEETL